MSQDEELDKFRTEAALMRRLEHFNITRIFDYREDRDHRLAVISMELIRGRGLQSILELAKERGEPIPAPLVLTILEEMLSALVEAHGKGGIHGDVKPENVLLATADVDELLESPTKDPQIKMIDFGPGGNVSAEYAAPELMKHSRPQATPATDVYGAAAVVYQLLTGKFAIGNFSLPARMREDLPDGFRDLLLRLLDPSPEKRPDARSALERSRDLAERSREEWDWESKW